MEIPTSTLPHGKESVLVSGNTTNPAKALILIHGRGATAQDILAITSHLNVPDNVIVLTPQAHSNTWYPARFIESQSVNQPGLNSALDRIDTLIAFLESEFKISAEYTTIAGFSQGACLTSEYLKRNPKRYLGAAICSGGLIGEEKEVAQMVEGSLSGTPVYIGCDEEDFHIPKERVLKTASYLTEHHGDVRLGIYKNLGHAIHEEAFVFMEGVLGKEGAKN